MLRIGWLATLLMLAVHAHAEDSAKPKPDGNRLAYLDEPLNPYYPHKDFPKLITPQWVGEEGVECVVTLGIDDMRDPQKYEAYLRPILDRLKQIDGRAPVSIMTCQVKPDDPQLQAWLKEGLSIECHTYDHPCPCLKESSLAKAKETYDKCVDLIHQIPGNRPVAFRMPCCDSLNTPSPRFWAEVFNKTTEKGNFLQIDSSVFNIITGRDESLPKEIRLNEAGEERFRRYVPFKDFVNTIEDYPYPYIIGRMCWEFPCVVPSDWSAQHVQKPNNPETVRDWKYALDAVVLKQGVFNLVFHPHNWIRPEQVVELIDYADKKYGKKVKFLTFKECAERLNRNLLVGNPLRPLARGIQSVGVADYNQDGYVDVDFVGVVGNNQTGKRLWLAAARQWRNDRAQGTSISHSLSPFREGDINGDGKQEFMVLSPKNRDVRDRETGKVLFQRPALGIARPNEATYDAAWRFVDVNNDNKLDCLFSNAERYSLHLFKDMHEGWSIKVIEGVRGQEGGMGPEIPPFVRADGTNNGAFFHSKALWTINEDTARFPNHAFKLTFAEMLK
jgi:hypothetical protein